MISLMNLFLSSPHPPTVLARGLYAGLKSRGGLPTPLPVLIGKETYVNAGFIDGLSPRLLQNLGLIQVKLRIIFYGAISLQWYYLDRDGSIRHYLDTSLASETTSTTVEHNIAIPSILLNDDNVSRIYFRVCHDYDSSAASSSTLVDWCFYAEASAIPTHQPLLMVSRSLGEALHLVNQHYSALSHLKQLREQFSDLHFLPFPCLHLYESDTDSYHVAQAQLRAYQKHDPEISNHLVLKQNPYNLGGGGNMCLAIKRAIVDKEYRDNYVILDSDTCIPFKTLYSTALINAFEYGKPKDPTLISPIVAYRKRPTQVLEAGALFGRGIWNIASSQPLQPGISPLFHRADLTDKCVQARLSKVQSSDYPLFIYSLICTSDSSDLKDYLPAPFFLRGDDIEYGIHHRYRKAATSVYSELLVFQDPKHSLWHEAMAILHATVILIAYNHISNNCLLGDNLSKYFEARLSSHASIRDLKGISVYQHVLSRLLSLLDVPSENLLVHFYNPDYYRELRQLNADHTEMNYKLAQSLPKPDEKHSYAILPFLYFPQYSDSERLPESIFLMNHMTETAVVYQPSLVRQSDLQNACLKYRYSLSRVLADLEALQKSCRTLLDRDLIMSLFNQAYAEEDASCHQTCEARRQ